MRIRFVALASAALISLAACAESASVDVAPGAAIDVVAEDPLEQLYSPETRDALALGLPDQVGGMALTPSSSDVIAEQQRDYATDSRIRGILVADGLSPSRVTVEQKTAAIVGVAPSGEHIPPVGLAAVQVKDIPAEAFVAWDPTFYLLLTSVEAADYQWQGEKPGRDEAVIAGRPVWMADFGRFKVAWYPYGDVLYVVVAANDQLLETSVERLPWSGDTI